MASPQGIKAGSAFIELLVHDGKLVKGLQKASRKLKAFGDAIAGWGRKMAMVGTAVAAPLVASAKVFAEMGDRIAKASARTGVSVETISELGYAAEMSGASLEILEGSLRRMQKTIIAAAEGGKSATEALAKLGLTVDDLRGLSPDEQFKLIADRLSQIKSPAFKAAVAMELFGRAGTQLLPMMSNGAAGIEALQQQARALGLTMSTEDALAAAALKDTFTVLWKVLKQGVFVIGSALAPTLKAVSEWIIDTVVTATAWIKQNKELVVSIFKVAAGIVAGGVALMALGYAITTVGAVLGALAGIIAGVGAALGMLGAIIVWLVSPIGLTIAAIVALGAYLVYVSGTGGKALAWLGDRFADLSEFASESFQGISDALMAGDIALAAKVLWTTLKIVWQKGVLELTHLWEGLKSGAMKVVYGMWYGIQAAWEIGTSSVAEIMLKLHYGMMDMWERLSTGVMNVWDSTINWVAKRIIDLWGLVDSTLDTDDIKKGLDDDAQSRIGDRNREKNANLQRIAQERSTALKMLDQDQEQNLARIGQAAINAENLLDAEAQKKINAAQAELEAAKKEWQAAIGEARQKRQMKDAEGPKRLDRPLDIGDYLEGLGPVIEQAKEKTVGVNGTFNAMEARGMAGGPVADRIAKATEETAKHTKKLLQEAQMGGLSFD
ncbi:MAG: phage tail tape measure protein [Phycisphaerales bacterium]|nr:phage tail tape measure protein [Phycisphaerales bacterium]